MESKDKEMYELSIRKLTEAFDEFIGECLSIKDGQRAPTAKALIKARGCLPYWCKNTIVKK